MLCVNWIIRRLRVYLYTSKKKKNEVAMAASKLENARTKRSFQKYEMIDYWTNLCILMRKFQIQTFSFGVFGSVFFCFLFFFFLLHLSADLPRWDTQTRSSLVRRQWSASDLRSVVCICTRVYMTRSRSGWRKKTKRNESRIRAINS